MLKCNISTLVHHFWTETAKLSIVLILISHLWPVGVLDLLYDPLTDTLSHFAAFEKQLLIENILISVL